MCNDAIRLNTRSERAVVDVDKISDQGEARMKNVNKEDSKENGRREIEDNK